MGRKILLVLLAVVLVVSFVSVNFAAEKKGNARKGKYLFRKNCRSCHQDGGNAVELSPANKTQEEWDKVFAAGSFEKLECKVEWEKRSEKDLKDIYTYMYNHAFDSPSPAKCK